jgi:hypothetical protein
MFICTHERRQSAGGHYSWLFWFTAADATSKQDACKIMARAGWDYPGTYTDDLTFACATTDGRAAHRAWTALHAAGALV